LNPVYVDELKRSKLPPILTDFPIPTPPLKTTEPVFAAVVLLVELNVAVPVEAPNERVVAAPKALTFVAFVLKTANVALPVVTLVVNSGEVPKTRAPDPVSPVIVLSSSDDVVAAKSDNLLLVVAKVPVVGSVTLVVFVVVNVRLCPPEVINEDPLAKVNVAEVAGEVNVSLLTVDAVTAPLLCMTPDIDEATDVPVYNEPPIPTPPVTTKAPELVPTLTAELVILTVPPIKALPANPKPPVTDKAPDVGDTEEVALVTTVVPPINAFLATPKPPKVTNEPVPVFVDSVVCALLNQPLLVLKLAITVLEALRIFISFPPLPICIWLV
jgi:hypothetical protein